MSGSGRLNLLYLVRTWAFGGSHTIVLHLLEHLPKDRFNIVCVPYDTRSGADEAFVEQARKRGLSVADERIPWRSRLNWSRARQTVSDLVEQHQIDLVHTHDPHSNVLVGLAGPGGRLPAWHLPMDGGAGCSRFVDASTSGSSALSRCPVSTA